MNLAAKESHGVWTARFIINLRFMNRTVHEPQGSWTNSLMNYMFNETRGYGPDGLWSVRFIIYLWFMNRTVHEPHGLWTAWFVNRAVHEPYGL